MKVTVEMGREECARFLQYEDERPRLQAEIGRLRSALKALAAAVDGALYERAGEIWTDPAAARELLRLAGKYL